MRISLQFMATDWYQDAKRAVQVAIIASMIGALFSLCLPSYYKSDATLLPMDSRGTGAMGGLAATAAAFGFGIPGQEGPETSYPEIIQSRWLRTSLLNTSFTYSRKWSLFGDTRTETKTLREYLNEPNEDQALLNLSRMLVVQRDLKSKKTVLSVETQSPELSQQIVNKTVHLLEQFLLEKSQTKGKVKAMFLAGRLVEAKQKLTTLEGAFESFMVTNRNYNQSTDPFVRLQGLRLEAELRLQQQVVATLTLNREQALLEEKNDMPLLNLLDGGNCPIEHSRPVRIQIVLFTFLVGLAATLGWFRRSWIKQTIAGTV